MNDEQTGSKDAAAPQAAGAKKAAGASMIKLKVSEKGALSVYGLGRFPVTLYKEQWKRLLEQGENIKAFLAQHDADLKSKGDAPAAAAETPAAAEKTEAPEKAEG
jgi:hypothetical protein